MTKVQNRIRTLFFISFAIISTSLIAQTTFTESAALPAYNLNIGGNKDGGHAWADYDLDGDYDLVINTNGRGYLLRNDGASGFVDVTASLAPDFFNNSLERTVLFVDFNNDGYPDIFRNDHTRVKIYLQDPATNRFGNGIGGTTPNQTFNSGNIADGFNSEGAGALDYDGDGDLDIFIDNHNFGIDVLQNDGAGNFTQVTKKSDSPNPPYNAGDPTTWPLGLAQDAVDGDYGSATDFNNDGWVDIVVRKRNQVDLFTNLGGIFQDGVDIDQARNNNKGAVAFQDFDNDGDFDLFWTENGANQIHRNNGDGTWTPLGAATGIPINFSGQMEGLACGDVDNDGDIDIYLGNGGTGGNHRSRLYLNQINNGGGVMTFVDSGLTFNNRNEGSTFIDIDEDGDLDLYVNKNGVANELWINNLGAAAQANHLYIDVIEDRDAFGLINLEKRFGIGATATILDCDGNVISGIREVNGGYGHGTQEPGVIHFGLPGGPNTQIVLEIAYPRHGTGLNDRVVVRQELRPIDFFNGNINIITILPTSGNQPPIAQDDLISVTQGSSVTFNPLADNGNGIDSDPDSNPFSVISITQPANGTAVLNGDGTITYTPNVGFFGSDPFTYTLEDSTSCTQTNQQSIGNVLMIVNNDNDGDGIANDIDLDDDNDGIPDTEESQCEVNLSPPGAPPSSNVIANLGTRLYTDYGGYWTSAVGSVNPVKPDNNSHLLAFEMGGQTYPTGVPNSRLIDTDSNGFFDLLDTDGDGTGDVALVETSWTALTPIQDITSGIRLEGALLDGNAVAAVGPLLTSGGAPFNPYLSQGTRGLDMAYSIANIGNTWFFNIQGIQASAYNDGVFDILLTQVAAPGASTNNTVHLLDNSGNYIGNGVTVNWNTVSSMGKHLTDGYFPNDAVQGTNSGKPIRFGGIELSEFNLTPAEITNAVALRLNISADADPAFFVVNDQSFISNCVDFDTDGDGIPNRFDLDSDNDGILDAEEAGHGQTHTNGVVNGAVGTDGIPDAVQASPNSGTVNYTIAESTDDTDTIPNYLDLDSDGDGIPDNVEAQTTLGYTPPSGTVDANGVFTNYTGGLTPEDTDGDLTPDYLDLDSDNEGGTDTTEAGIALANADADNDGLDDNTDATVGYSDQGGTIDNPLVAPVILLDSDNDANSGGDVDFRDAADDRPDNDGDGIADVDDLDDDNDGILDTDEGCGNLIINGNFEAQNFTDATTFPNGFTAVNGTFIGSTYNANTLYGWDYTQNMDGWVGGAPLGANTFADAYSRNQYLDVIGNNSASSPVGENNVLSQTIPTIVGQSYTLSFYWGEDIGHNTGAPVEMDVRVRDAVTTTIIQSQNLTTTATGNVGGVVGPKNWFAYSQIFTATSVQTTIEFETTPDGTANGTALDYVSVFKNGTCQDTDNDGVIDAFDLDADNDGILDAVEAGHNQPHTNGEVNGSVGDDGLPDAVQDSPNNEQTNYTIAESTDDTDTIANFLDLDSDGDGIPDNVEAQTTIGYTAPSGTVDANGVFTNYTSGLTPTNTDGADNPDYLDTDSDNEGANDTTEAGITLANADADKDGLDDNTDATAGYSDPGGTIDNPLTAPLILPDIDNDATTGGDVDFRDAQNEADLSLTKTVNDAQPDQGDTITFTLTITNGGSSSPTSIVVGDVLPADVTFINATPATGTATFDAGTRVLTWNLGAFVLGTGNTSTLTYTVTVDVCGEFVNQAEIISSSLTDPDSTTNNGG